MSQEKQKEVFNPNNHLIQLKSKEGSKDYLPVQYRLVWFRQECPQGTIETEEIIVDLDRDVEEEVFTWNNEKRRSEKSIKQAKGYARFKAVVTDGKGGRATGTKSENGASFPDYVEKAETGAIGRALAALGYGTQFTADFDEGERIIDAPVPGQQKVQKPEDGQQEEGTQGQQKQTASTASNRSAPVAPRGQAAVKEKAVAPEPQTVVETSTKPITVPAGKEPTLYTYAGEIIAGLARFWGVTDFEHMRIASKVPEKDHTKWDHAYQVMMVREAEKQIVSPQLIEKFEAFTTLFGARPISAVRKYIPGAETKARGEMNCAECALFLQILSEARPLYLMGMHLDKNNSHLRTTIGVDHVLNLFPGEKLEPKRQAYIEYLFKIYSENQALRESFPTETISACTDLIETFEKTMKAVVK